MLQNYTNISPVSEHSMKAYINRGLLMLLTFASLSFAVYTAYVNKALPFVIHATDTDIPVFTPKGPGNLNDIPGIFRTDSVATVITKALYFRSLLTATQIATLEQTYTSTAARKWSNLPCGSGCRNGIQFANLNATQLAAALDVIKAAAGTATNQGYSQFSQIRLAEEVLQATAGGNNYDSSIYFISFLNTPTLTGTWMLQFGGHHYAANIAYNAGKVVGTTPEFCGVEPISFTINSTTYTPMAAEHDSMTAMLASLTTAQLATAKLSGTFSDVTLAPGETNGGSGTFPATKQGIAVSTLNAAQKALIIAAIKTYTQDVDDSSGAVLQAIYASEIEGTYIGYTGNGTSGNPTTFLNANTNYVRIDGPSVWIEFVCQSGVVFPAQIHYHSVYRDHYRDYGLDLTRTTLPLGTLSFDVRMVDKQRQLYWNTVNEQNVAHYSIERSTDARSFTSVGKVTAANTSSASYTFNDKEAIASNEVFYRLQVVDKDGLIQYSKTISIKNKASGGFTVYPNPATNLISLSPSDSFKDASIKIISNSGKIVVTTTHRQGSKVDLDISKLANGIYIIQVVDSGILSSARFIKQGSK